jgi:hypothetical protein
MEAETERRMGEKMTEIYDKIKDHAVTQSDAEPTQIERVARAICRVNHNDPDRRMPTNVNPPDGRPVWTAYEREARAAITALAQSDTGHDDPLPREHQDASKWVSKEDMERAHHAQSDDYIPIGGAGNGA